MDLDALTKMSWIEKTLFAAAVSKIEDLDTPIPSYQDLLQELHKVHSSWIKEPLYELEKPLGLWASLVLLPQQIEDSFFLEKRDQIVSIPAFEQIWLKFWCARLQIDEHSLPLMFPEGPLKFFLKMDDKSLVLFTRLMGIIFLAQEIRQIVDRNLLMRMYAALEPKEQLFLRGQLQKRFSLGTPFEYIKSWDGTVKGFQHLVYKIGFSALTTMVSSLQYDFSFLLARRMEKARGERLLSAVAENKEERYEHLIPLQQEIIHFMKENASL